MNSIFISFTALLSLGLGLGGPGCDTPLATMQIIMALFSQGDCEVLMSCHDKPFTQCLVHG